MACLSHHTARLLTFYSCCGVQVILPLALTVAKQQQELAAAAAAKPTMKPGAAVSVAGRDTTPPECMDMIPKGTHTPAHTCTHTVHDAGLCVSMSCCPLFHERQSEGRAGGRGINGSSSSCLCAAVSSRRVPFGKRV